MEKNAIRLASGAALLGFLVWLIIYISKREN